MSPPGPHRATFLVTFLFLVFAKRPSAAERAKRAEPTPLVHSQRSERSEQNPPRTHSPSSHQPRPSPLMSGVVIGISVRSSHDARHQHSFVVQVLCLDVHAHFDLFPFCCYLRANRPCSNLPSGFSSAFPVGVSSQSTCVISRAYASPYFHFIQTTLSFVAECS